MEKVIYTIYYLPTVPKVGMTKDLERRTKENVRRYNIDPKTVRTLAVTEDRDYGEGLESYYQDWYNCSKTDPGYSHMAGVRQRAQTLEARSRKSQSLKGNSNSYGIGFLFKELSTGFVGYRADHVHRFNLPEHAMPLYHNLTRNAPVSRGKYKGLQWIVID